MDPFDIITANSFLPIIDNTEDVTRKLINAITMYSSLLDEKAKPTLINFILTTRLSDNAKFRLSNSYNSVEELISDMNKHLLTTKSFTSIQKQLLDCTQKEEETIEKYGKQIEDLLVDLTISQAEGDENKFKVLRPINEKMAIKQFASGLKNSKLSAIILAKEFNSIKDAVQSAIDENISCSDTTQVQKDVPQDQKGHSHPKHISHGEQGRDGQAEQPHYGQAIQAHCGHAGQAPYGQAIQAPYGQTSQAHNVLAIQAPYGQAGQAPYGQAGQAPYGQASQALNVQAIEAPYGQAIQAPYRQAGQAPYGQASQALNVQAIEAPYGQAIQAPYGQATQAHCAQDSPAHYGQASQAYFAQANQTPYGQAGQIDQGYIKHNIQNQNYFNPRGQYRGRGHTIQGVQSHSHYSGPGPNTHHGHGHYKPSDHGNNSQRGRGHHPRGNSNATNHTSNYQNQGTQIKKFSKPVDINKQYNTTAQQNHGGKSNTDTQKKTYNQHNQANHTKNNYKATDNKNTETHKPKQTQEKKDNNHQERKKVPHNQVPILNPGSLKLSFDSLQIITNNKTITINERSNSKPNTQKPKPGSSNSGGSSNSNAKKPQSKNNAPKNKNNNSNKPK